MCEVGNVIAVRVCAQFVGWENYAKEGRLVVRIANSPESMHDPQCLFLCFSGSSILDLAEPTRRKLGADITAQVEINGRIQDAIKAVYEASYSTALDLGIAPPPYTLNPPAVVATELRADMPTGRDQRPLRILSLGRFIYPSTVLTIHLVHLFRWWRRTRCFVFAHTR